MNWRRRGLEPPSAERPNPSSRNTCHGSISLVCVVIAWALLDPTPLRADVMWSYSSTDGIDIMSGTLLTDGDVADALALGNTFNLLEISSVFVNGVEQLDPVWANGVGAPFNVSPSGTVLSDGLGGGSISSNTLRAVNSVPAPGNNVQIGHPGAGGFQTYAQAGMFNVLVGFNPTSTTLSVVPEPSAAFLSLIPVCALLHRRRRPHRRGPRVTK